MEKRLIEPLPTVASVARFANATQEDQLAELARLRSVSSASERMSILIGAVAIYLAFSAIVLAEGGKTLLSQETSDMTLALVVNTIIYFVGLAIAIGTTAVIVRVGISVSKQATSARTVLAAYEAELSRRNQATGRHARAWRRAHPIEWS